MSEPISDLKQMMQTVPQVGRIEQILLRRERKGLVERVSEASVVLSTPGGRPFPWPLAALKATGDGHPGGASAQIAALAGCDRVDPVDLRRNLVISGIPVVAMKDRRFRVGPPLLDGASAPAIAGSPAGPWRVQRHARHGRGLLSGRGTRTDRGRRHGRRRLSPDTVRLLPANRYAPAATELPCLVRSPFSLSSRSPAAPRLPPRRPPPLRRPSSTRMQDRARSSMTTSAPPFPIPTAGWKTRTRRNPWIEAENAITYGHLDSIPFRSDWKDRVTALWNYERFGTPWEEGDRYFWYRNDGLQDQSVLWTAESLDGEAAVLLDPNTFSEDGTISLGAVAVSPDGRHIAYATSDGGSDWRTVKVRNIETGADLDEQIEAQVQRDELDGGLTGSSTAVPRAREPAGAGQRASAALVPCRRHSPVRGRARLQGR